MRLSEWKAFHIHLAIYLLLNSTCPENIILPGLFLAQPYSLCGKDINLRSSHNDVFRKWDIDEQTQIEAGPDGCSRAIYWRYRYSYSVPE
jgi:hypothetical protein